MTAHGIADLVRLASELRAESGGTPLGLRSAFLALCIADMAASKARGKRAVEARRRAQAEALRDAAGDLEREGR